MRGRTLALGALLVAAACIGHATSAVAQEITSRGTVGPLAMPRTDQSSVFMGGVPHGELSPDPVPLGLRDAIDRGLEHNLGVLLQEQGLVSARGSRWESLSGLLPDVSARLGAARRVASLAEFGFTSFPGVTSTTIGPFNVFDMRVAVSQPA